jgi:parallel beta-helix repeat protein
VGGASSSDANVVNGTATEKPGDGSGGRVPEVDGGIVINGFDNIVEANVLTNNDGWGAVEVDNGTGNTITKNAMTGNTQGIALGYSGYTYYTDITTNPSGPNDLEYYPVLLSTSSSPSGTTVNGRIEQAGTVTIDLYSQAGCGLQAETPGQGAQYLGSTTVSSTLGGETFSMTGLPTPSGQTAITATATGFDGSTSEFSPCLLTDSQALTLLGYGVRPPSSAVPITVTSAAAAPEAGASAGATSSATGEGTLWLLCPGETTGSCTGKEKIETTGTSPTMVSSQSFTMVAGSAAEVTVQLSGTLLSGLQSTHRVKVELTTAADDAASPPQEQKHHQRLTLTYR